MKKKIGIMQPYFFPYIGYWQIINIVDTYVILDDVNYINRGWINRNRILGGNRIQYFNINIKKASQNKKINELMIFENEKDIQKKLRTIQTIYKKAPYYESVYNMIYDILYCGKENLVDFIMNSFKVICDYLEIDTSFVKSSSIEKNNLLKGQDRIIEICKKLNATEYYNAIGGRELYNKNDFKTNKIELFFLKVNNNEIYYKQFGEEFISDLSIIDVMMFNSVERIKSFLSSYILM